MAALLACMSVAWGGEPGQSGRGQDKDRVEKLIKQLNSDKFAERERATGALEKLGMAAYDSLKKAAADKNTDLETKSRAEKILSKLQLQAESATLLAPTKVHLVLKDTPVSEAVKQLSKKSGYQIAIVGDASKVAGKKITLDTGETTFWQAFDQLCKEAGLVQMQTVAGSNQYNIRFGNAPGVMPGGPIQLQPLPAAPPRAVPVPKVAPQPVQKDEQAARDREVQAMLAAAQAEVIRARFQVAAAENKAIAIPAGGQAAGPGAAAPPPQAQFQPVQRVMKQPISPYGDVAVGGQINVTAGKAEDYPTHYSGALRFRVVPYDRNTMSWIPTKSTGETLLILEVCAEPKLSNFRIGGSARVAKAIDDQGQALDPAMDPMPNAAAVGNGPAVVMPIQMGNPYMTGSNRELVPIRLKLGEKQAKGLKDLVGGVTAECLSPPMELLAIDDVLKAAGKSAKAKDGSGMELVEINKQENGDVRLKVRLDSGQGDNALPGAVRIMRGGMVQQIQIAGAPGGGFGGPANANGMPSLVDAQGKAYQLVSIPQRNLRGVNNVFTQELLFRPSAGQGEPTRLVLQGRRNAHVQATFSFKDVPVP
jgi:hypothetical protein